MLKNIKLSSKLILGFAVPLLAIVVIIGVSVYFGTSVKSNANTAQNSSKASFEYAMLAQKMKLDIVQVQQWLTDISATRGLDGLDDGFSEAENSKNSFLEGLAKFQKLYKEINDAENLEITNNLQKAFESYYVAGKTMAKAYVEDGPQGGNKMMASFDQAAASLAEAFNPLIKQQGLQGSSALELVKSAVEKLELLTMVIGAICIFLSMLAAWLIIRSVTTPIHVATKGLTAGAEQISGAAGQVSSLSQSLAEGASEQAASIEETSASMEEMSAMTKQNADNANQADSLMKATLSGINTADTSMEGMNTSMEDIAKASEETSKIVKTIDEIAFQTNLLALNAAVEAARAGEAGAGFAVVADEVRNLAMRAAEAAKNTAGLIEGTVQKVGVGQKTVSDAMEAFKDVAENSTKVGSLVSEIATASQEQAQGFQQINTAITEMDSVTQQNSAAAEQSAAASEELNGQAATMMDMIMGLKSVVDGSDVSLSTQRDTVRPRQKATPPAEPVTSRRAISAPVHQSAADDPKKIIPMDGDDEFEDF